MRPTIMKVSIGTIAANATLNRAQAAQILCAVLAQK